MELTQKQKKFVRQYNLNGGNATKAAITVGYSKKTAYRMGYENLKKPQIKVALARKEAAIEKKYEVTEAQIINELKLIGFSDIQSYVKIDKDTGAIQAKGFEEMPEGSSRALESISEDRIIHENAKGDQIVVNDKRKFRCHSKIEALKLLASIKGMTREKDPNTPSTL